MGIFLEHDPRSEHRSNFLSFTIEQGLFRYVEAKLKKAGKQIMVKHGRPLLSSACGAEACGKHLKYYKHCIRADTVRLLLQYGADTNEEFQGDTPWVIALGATTFSRIMRTAK